MARAPRPLPRRARRVAPRHRQRAARLRRDRRRAAVRAARRRQHVRRDLLQQRRLHRHVRPRHDRPRRHARAPRPHRSRAITGSKRRSAPSPRRCTPTARSRVANVPSYRHATQVRVDVPATASCTATWPGAATGSSSAATTACRSSRGSVGELTAFATRVRDALRRQGVTGRDGAEIDHVELFGPPADPRQRRAQLRALPRRRLRPLALRHRHQRQARLPGRRRQARARRAWRQESVIGSVFTRPLHAPRGAAGRTCPRTRCCR